jgi:hypothetical protein
MSLIKCLACISPAAITLPTLHSEPHCPGNIPSLRFHLVQRSRIIVPVVINHTGPHEFLVDTGAQFTVVDPLLATELHLKTQGSAEVDRGYFRMPVVARYIARDFSSQFSSLTENNRRACGIVSLSFVQSLRDCRAV